MSCLRLMLAADVRFSLRTVGHADGHAVDAPLDLADAAARIGNLGLDSDEIRGRCIALCLDQTRWSRSAVEDLVKVELGGGLLHLAVRDRQRASP